MSKLLLSVGLVLGSLAGPAGVALGTEPSPSVTLTHVSEAEQEGYKEIYCYSEEQVISAGFQLLNEGYHDIEARQVDENVWLVWGYKW